MRVTILGCGDAFGSGGRLQTSYLVESGKRTILLDCGATFLTGLERVGADANAIDTIVISHLHGDHYAGLVWFLLHARHVAKREAPLTIVGPAGLEERLKTACEALYAGSTDKPLRFEIVFRDLDLERAVEVAGLSIEAFEVSHPSGALSAAVRLTHDTEVLAFSGDSEWVAALVDCARGADLFICECYFLEPGVAYHINYRTLSENLPRIEAGKILLTHMGPQMLAAVEAGALGAVDPRIMFAEDGMVLEI
jgi:ribonuclease BN (tRNA processing enzyme)